MGTHTKRLRRAIFLDRDGVINACPGHSRRASPKKRFVTRWSEFRFLPGTLKALERLHRERWVVIVVSNQSAIGRGIMTRDQLEKITRRMLEKIESTGGKIHAVFYCLHHPDAGCSCRKPKTGLLKKAARRFGVDLQRSLVVGDDEADVAMGSRAGCQTILVLSGKQTPSTARRMSVQPHRTVKDLDHAVRYLLEHP